MQTNAERAFEALSWLDKHRVLVLGLRSLEALKSLPTVGLEEVDKEKEDLVLKYEAQSAELEELRERLSCSTQNNDHLSGEDLVKQMLNRLYPRYTVWANDNHVYLEFEGGEIEYTCRDDRYIDIETIDNFRAEDPRPSAVRSQTVARIFVARKGKIPNNGTFHVEQTTKGLLIYIGKTDEETESILECRLAVVTEWAMQQGCQILSHNVDLHRVIQEAHLKMHHFKVIRHELNSVERAMHHLKEACTKSEASWLQWVREAISTMEVVAAQTI